MDWVTFEATALLHAQLPRLTRRIQTAQDKLRSFFVLSDHPYIAYSGGKDSQVVLDIALSMESDCTVVWSDEGWIVPGTLAVLRDTEERYNISIVRARERYGAKEFYAQYGCWPQCETSREVDYVADTWSEVIAYFAFDGVALGLRRDESVTRLFSLKTPLQSHSDGLYHVNPLANWSLWDVWAYILSRHLPYHTAYSLMINCGVSPQYARVGPLTAVRVYQFGLLATVKRLWPDLWNEYVSQNPCVAGFS